MENRSNKLLTVFNRIIIFILAVAAGIVLAVSVVTTIYYDMHDDNDFPHYKTENFLLLAISLALALGLLYVLYRTGALLAQKRLMLIALLFVTAYVMMLILAIHPRAVNDSKMLDDVINQFARGDYSAFEPAGYLFIWPFQLGYVAFGQVMHTVFGESNYFAWDIVQLISVLITMFLIYRMADELFENKKVVGLTCVLSFGALFFYNYATYIYGDILSMAPQTLALYLMVRYLKTDRMGYAVGSAASIAAAIIIKTNCEITLIALMMLMLGHELAPAKKMTLGDGVNGSFSKMTPQPRPLGPKSPEPKSLGPKSPEPKSPGPQNPGPKRLARTVALTAVFLAFTFGAKAALNAYYCQKIGLEQIPAGSPSVSHIVMGLQESDLEDGWFNGYNYRVFEENNYDVAATGAAATADLKERLSVFAHHPGYAAKFLLRKYVTQWADPVCVSTHNLDLVSRHVDNQPALCDFLVFGAGSKALSWIMNVFMTLCYLGVVIFLARAFRKGDVTQPQMLLLILIFGGILFHEFWEGSSRYAMRYYIYWLPYAASGLEVLFGFICKHRKSTI